jgi:hypothetical protein
MIEPDVYTRLQDSISGLVGGTGGGFSSGFSSGFQTPSPGRVYPVTPTENTELPFVVYSRTGTTPALTLQGLSGLTTYTVSIDAYALTFEESLTISEAIENAFSGWRAGEIQLANVTTGAGVALELGFQQSHEVTIHKRIDA